MQALTAYHHLQHYPHFNGHLLHKHRYLWGSPYFLPPLVLKPKLNAVAELCRNNKACKLSFLHIILMHILLHKNDKTSSIAGTLLKKGTSHPLCQISNQLARESAKNKFLSESFILFGISI